MSNPNQTPSPMDVSPELEKEIRDQGLEFRWISAAAYQKNHGFHKNGWVPYKKKKNDKKTAGEELFGADPHGYVRFRDSILAVRKSEEVQADRAALADKNRRIKESMGSKSDAKTLRGNTGNGIRVVEGYDDEEDA